MTSRVGALVKTMLVRSYCNTDRLLLTAVEMKIEILVLVVVHTIIESSTNMPLSVRILRGKSLLFICFRDWASTISMDYIRTLQTLKIQKLHIQKQETDCEIER